jgi:hypothetical protein
VWAGSGGGTGAGVREEWLARGAQRGTAATQRRPRGAHQGAVQAARRPQRGAAIRAVAPEPSVALRLRAAACHPASRAAAAAATTQPGRGPGQVRHRRRRGGRGGHVGRRPCRAQRPSVRLACPSSTRLRCARSTSRAAQCGRGGAGAAGGERAVRLLSLECTAGAGGRRPRPMDSRRADGALRLVPARRARRSACWAASGAAALQVARSGGRRLRRTDLSGGRCGDEAARWAGARHAARGMHGAPPPRRRSRAARRSTLALPVLLSAPSAPHRAMRSAQTGRQAHAATPQPSTEKAYSRSCCLLPVPASREAVDPGPAWPRTRRCTAAPGCAPPPLRRLRRLFPPHSAPARGTSRTTTVQVRTPPARVRRTDAPCLLSTSTRGPSAPPPKSHCSVPPSPSQGPARAPVSAEASWGRARCGAVAWPCVWPPSSCSAYLLARGPATALESRRPPAA